ncbi:MAG: RelA/SpoT AH/RIS domain-containing protein, partial [Gammaproteobacteria bacterium]
EIITAPGASPNPMWLNFVVTGKARSNIRHFLKSQQHSQLITLGRRLLEKALSALSASLEDTDKENLAALIHNLHYESLDELCEEIGTGNQVALVIAQRLTHQYEELSTEALKKQTPLAIRGTEGMVVTYAECCHPIPGDPIVGCLQSGRGLSVHLERCPNVTQFRDAAEQFISMCWEDKVAGEFQIDLLVRVINRRGALAQLASAIADAEANTENVQLLESDGQQVVLEFTISVRDRVHLARVMRRLRANKVVTRLTRMNELERERIKSFSQQLKSTGES